MIRLRDEGCCICGTYSVHLHHVFFGSANRRVSDDMGFIVKLCAAHHTGTEGVHGKNGDGLNKLLKQVMQARYEETHTRVEWMLLIGRNYLD